ncbi:MAG: sulfurtransferase [Rhodanobacteraceae bacterium]|jgi:rhodanese-related sulfurtransferase|nr:sulfurtransferase [Rhodanobacteraceae bacterium]MBL0042822.1 sulfurtransferase [Xanthomonadales bacterium]MBP6079419.1 sulfurtransferase [Xanthomonadales bacterium]
MKTAQDLVVDAKTRIREIGHEELLALQRGGAPIVDVREPDEYHAGHIPGSINIPRGVLEFQVDGHPAVNCLQDPALAHRSAAIVLSCRSGARSALAADALRQLGFAEPVSLAGGFNGWSAAARPIHTGDQP